MGSANNSKQIIFLLFYIVMGVLFAGLVLTLMALFNGNLNANGLDLNSPTNLNFLRFTLVLNHLGMFLLPALAFSYYPSNYWLNLKQIEFNFNKSSILKAVFLALIAMPFISYLGYINQQIVLPNFLSDFELVLKSLELQAEEVTLQLLSKNNFTDVLINLLIIAFIPAVGEELIFRGVVQPVLLGFTKNFWVGIILTAIIFSAMHLQFYGFLPRVFIGIILGIIVFKSGSLVNGIVAHFVNNGVLVLIIAYVANFTEIPLDGFIKTTNTDSANVLIALISFTTTVYFTRLFYFKKS